MQIGIRIRRLYRWIAAPTRGVAAIEFAMIMPVLAILFLASFDGARALAVYMKVRAATYSLAAITNQYQTIASSDMTLITGATSTILAPYSQTPAILTVSQIAISNKGKATVAWSYSQGGTALVQGSSVTVPSALITNSSYLIFAQVSYTFSPIFGLFTAGTINLKDNLYVTPRSSICVVYTPQQTVTACT
ncbi:MAG: TadE/TadG family type IV pilus assembly protein [Xanthobacteraceae bacterium]|jgi:Flp pilus assembly protein TadG